MIGTIDVGTNTVRLLVCDERLQHVARDQRITRLGKGVDATGRLDREAIARTLRAVVDFVARARELGAERIRVAGTSALRDAANGSEFLSAVHDETGLDVDVLDGATEGRCAYRGATSWLTSGDYVVCDIGGGSTELITEAEAVSFDVGSVRVRERFFTSDPPSTEEVASARAFARRTISSRAHADLIGVAGTITTVAALALGLSDYDSERVHGSRMTRKQVDEWAATLLAMPATQIAALGPVERGREDVIGAGSLILAVVMDELAAGDILVSERDLLDGLAADLVG